MQSRKVKCIVHIGIEKTGSSSIQNFLSENYSLLITKKVLYAKCAGHYAGQFSYPLIASESNISSDLGKNILLDNSYEAWKKGFVMNLKDEISQHSNIETLIISSEHLHSCITKIEEVKSFKKILSSLSQEFLIFIYLRRQDRISVSRYSTKVKNAKEFIPTFSFEPIQFYYEYDHLIRIWSEVFGVDCLRVFNYDEIINNSGGVLNHFISLTGLKGINPKNFAYVNKSISSEGFYLLNKYYAVTSNCFGTLDITYENFIRALEVVDCGNKMCNYNKQDAINFNQIYSQNNSAIPSLIGGKQDFFDSDYSEYSIDNCDRKYADGRLLESIRLSLQEFTIPAEGLIGEVIFSGINSIITIPVGDLVEISVLVKNHSSNIYFGSVKNRLGLSYRVYAFDKLCYESTSRVFFPENRLDANSSIEIKLSIRAPLVPAKYIFSISPLIENVSWLVDLGFTPLNLEINVSSFA